jgi:hypothetical protein
MPRFYPVFASAAVIVVVALHSTTATAQTRAPAPEREPLGSTIVADTLGALPASANVLSLLDAAQADFISDRLDTGGLSTGEAARVGAHGSSWTQTQFRIDGATLTDPQGNGAPLLLPGTMAWQRVEVATGLMPVEINAPGVAIMLEPRRPATAWTRVIEGFMSRPGLLSRTRPTNPPAISRLHAWNHANLFLSGPLVPGRLGLVLTSDWTRSSRFDRDNPTRLDSSLGSSFAHIELTPSARDDVRTVMWIERVRSPFVDRNAFGQPAAAERETAFHAQSTWERQIGPQMTWALVGSYTMRQRVPDVATAPAIVVERLSDGPVPALLNPWIGTDDTWSTGTRLISSGARMLGLHHSLHAGLEAWGSGAQAHPAFSGRVGELVDRLPARVWVYTSPARDSRWHEAAVTAYASDQMEVAPRVFLDVGIRYESIGGGAADSANHVRWNNWLPRASLHWDMIDRIGLAAFAGYGRYGYSLPLGYFAFGDAAAPVGTVSLWNTTRGDHPPALSEIGELVARVGPGTGGDPRFSAIDPALKRPYMDEIVIGFESRPRPSSVIRLAAIVRREQQLVGLLNVGVPSTSYSIIPIPDPGVDLASPLDKQLLPVFNRSRASFGADRYLLTNPANDRATFVGVDFAAQTNVRRLILMAGATAGRSQGLSGNRGFEAIENDQGVIGELFTNPNATTNARGRLFTERGYTLKTAGVYQFPRAVQLGLIARYQDGQHFARLVVVPGLNQGPEAIRAFANGRTRFTYSLTIDSRLQKGFAIGAHRVDAIFDTYNLLNTAKEVEEFPVTGAGARLPAAVQPPRAIHLGLRTTF